MNTSQEYVPPKNGFRTFLVLWFTQSISAFGSQLTFFALTIWIATVLYPHSEQKPELAFALSAIALAFGIPQVLSAPIAGAWADRHDRKRTMMVADASSGVLNLVLLALIVANVLQIWMLLILVVGMALASSFHYSAFDTSYAMIVPEKQLPRANGMMQTMWAFSAIISPAAAAFIVSLPGLARQGFVPGALGDWLRGWESGAPLAVAIDAATFFFGAFILLFLVIPSPKRTDLHSEDGKVKTSMWSDIKLGARYIWNRRPLLWLLATFTVINFASSPLEVFIPLLLKFNLAADWGARGFTFETALALLASVAGVGGVVGGLFISAWGGLKKKRIYGVVVPILISGVAQIVYGLSPFLFLTVAMNFLLVALMPIMNAHSQTIWQTQTPRELQGRVFAVRRLIAQFSGPLAVFISGIAGGLFNPGMVLAVLGGIVVLFAIFQLFNPSLLRVEDKAYLDELAARAGEPSEEQPGTRATTGKELVPNTSVD